MSSGKGTAGVAFFAANKTILSAPAIDLEGASTALHTVRVSAPQGAMAASVFVGKFDSTGGHIQARTLPAGLEQPPTTLLACRNLLWRSQQHQAISHSSMSSWLCSASLRPCSCRLPCPLQHSLFVREQTLPHELEAGTWHSSTQALHV